MQPVARHECVPAAPTTLLRVLRPLPGVHTCTAHTDATRCARDLGQAEAETFLSRSRGDLRLAINCYINKVWRIEVSLIADGDQSV
eukprot:SAG31_NODE_3709_length_3967_cov_8.847983_1_plen_86_part_00